MGLGVLWGGTIYEGIIMCSLINRDTAVQINDCIFMLWNVKETGNYSKSPGGIFIEVYFLIVNELSLE